MLSKHLVHPNGRFTKFRDPARALYRTMSSSNTLPQPASTPSTTCVPSKQQTTAHTPSAPPETPWRCKATPNQRSVVPDQRLQGVKSRLPVPTASRLEGLKLLYTRDDWQLSRATGFHRVVVRQYPLRGHGIWQEPHFRSTGAPWREREAGHRDQSIESARA